MLVEGNSDVLTFRIVSHSRDPEEVERDLETIAAAKAEAAAGGEESAVVEDAQPDWDNSAAAPAAPAAVDAGTSPPSYHITSFPAPPVS
jgi:hypothetical protein